MKKKIFLITGLICIAISLILNLIYNYIGSTIDINGFLKEPFFLIPISFFFFFIGLINLIIPTIIIIIEKYKKIKKNYWQIKLNIVICQA